MIINEVVDRISNEDLNNHVVVKIQLSGMIVSQVKIVKILQRICNFTVFCYNILTSLDCVF